MSNQTLFQRAGTKINQFSNAVRQFLDKYDAEAWPAFVVFLTVVTLGMVLNYVAFAPILGPLPAAIISGVFEAAIVAWKLTGNRKKNDVTQNDITNWAVWISVILAVAMLIINLFRIGGEKFESVAYITVGIAAVCQITFYLAFDQNDPDKKLKRDFNQGNRDVERENQNAHQVLGKVEARLEIVRVIADELERLNDKYKGLPVKIREGLLDKARKDLLEQYAPGDKEMQDETKGLVDLDGDGKIGEDVPF